MVRRMKATITQIESVVTPSGNSGHVVVPKPWIGKEAIVTLKMQKIKVEREGRLHDRYSSSIRYHPYLLALD
jgi:putative transposon-encoded protein